MDCTKMIANYHTHTWRCNHAYGIEKQYIENAIKAGLRILGFSDHTPYPFPQGYVGPDKMLPCQLEDYVDTVLRLRDEYRDDIEIHLGLEAEYYPELWEGLLRLIEPYPIEYLLLGQHFIHNEYEGDRYNGKPGHGEDDLRLYCRQCKDALETGKFLYFAHPDLINYSGDPALYDEEMTALCRFCKERGIPLEMNLLGVRQDRNYPNRRFWQIAAKEGNLIIYGTDAHWPEHVCSPEVVRKADRLLESYGIPRDRLLTTMPLGGSDAASVAEIRRLPLDLTFRTGCGTFNYRVGAIIIHEGKFLLMKNDEEPYYYTVGGRVRFDETTEETVLREVEEEIGVKLEIDRFLFFQEQFFDGKVTGTHIHELGVYYLMKDSPLLENLTCRSVTARGVAEEICWVPAGEIGDHYIVPESVAARLASLPLHPEHIIEIDER